MDLSNTQTKFGEKKRNLNEQGDNKEVQSIFLAGVLLVWDEAKEYFWTRGRFFICRRATTLLEI